MTTVHRFVRPTVTVTPQGHVLFHTNDYTRAEQIGFDEMDVMEFDPEGPLRMPCLEGFTHLVASLLRLRHTPNHVTLITERGETLAAFMVEEADGRTFGWQRDD